MAIAKQNECIRHYNEGTDMTGYIGSAVTGKRFVRVSANRHAGPALNTSTSGGNVTIAPATAAGRIFGVAGWDGAVGDLVDVRGKGVVPVTAEALSPPLPRSKSEQPEAITKTSGVAVGFVLSAAADGEDAQVVVASSLSDSSR